MTMGDNPGISERAFDRGRFDSADRPHFRKARGNNLSLLVPSIHYPRSMALTYRNLDIDEQRLVVVKSVAVEQLLQLVD